MTTTEDNLIPESQYTRVRNSIYRKAAQRPQVDHNGTPHPAPRQYHYDEHGMLTHISEVGPSVA